MSTVLGSNKTEFTIADAIIEYWSTAPTWQKVAFVVTAVFIGAVIAGLFLTSPFGLGLLTGTVALSIGIYAGATILTLTAAGGSHAAKNVNKIYKQRNIPSPPNTQGIPSLATFTTTNSLNIEPSSQGNLAPYSTTPYPYKDKIASTDSHHASQADPQISDDESKYCGSVFRIDL